MQYLIDFYFSINRFFSQPLGVQTKDVLYLERYFLCRNRELHSDVCSQNHKESIAYNNMTIFKKVYTDILYILPSQVHLLYALLVQ